MCRSYRSVTAADSMRAGGCVVFDARTAWCVGVWGHCTRRVLAALEVAVLGALLKMGVWVRLATVSKTAPHRVRSARVFLLGVDSVLIGVLLGAVAEWRTAWRPTGAVARCVRTARRPGSSMAARRRVRARRHCIGAPLCAPLDGGHPLACGLAPDRALGSVRGNLGRLRSEEVVLLGAARLADRRAARCRCSRTLPAPMASPVTMS